MLSPRFRRNGDRDLALARELLAGIQAAGVPTYRQTIPAIAAELRRCRRYERPLAVLTVALEGPSLPPPPAGAVIAAPGGTEAAAARTPLQSGMDAMLFLLLGTLLQDVTRESDIVAYAAEEHVYAIFLVEAAKPTALQAAHRLARALHERANVRIRAGAAEFPGNGLTVEALFDHAVHDMLGAPPVPLETETTEGEGVEWQNLRSAR